VLGNVQVKESDHQCSTMLQNHEIYYLTVFTDHHVYDHITWYMLAMRLVKK